MDVFKSLFVLCYFLVAVAAFSQEHRSSKLINQTSHKQPSSGGQFPWHVFISSVKCSGVFIHQRWVLSSAWCVKLIQTNLKLDNAAESDQPSTVFIRVGNHHLDLETPGEDSVPVLKALLYPKYNASTSSANFGLLYLARDVMLPNDEPVSRVKLPGMELLNDSVRLRAKITGWGHLSGRKSPFRTLGESNVLLNGHACQQGFTNGGKRKMLDDSWCVQAGTEGMCSIDQGSPVVIKRNNSWVVLGVYTHGDTCSSDKHAALFSRIDSSVLEWIQKLFTVGGERRITLIIAL